MNKIFKVFLSLFVLMGLSKGISCNEVIVTINGITYNCIAVGGGSGTILLKDCFKIYNLIGDTQCFGVLRRADVDELPDISDPGGGTGVTPGGGDGGSPTDPSDPVDPDPIEIDPVDEELIIDCECRECPVCGYCLGTDLPARCKTCICPAPKGDKIDLCSMNDFEIVNNITKWFEHFCKLRDINSDINIKLDDIMEDYQCFGGGFGGNYKNGSVSVNGGIVIRWQIQYDTFDPIQNEYLKFRYFDNEPSYYRASLVYQGIKGRAGINLIFSSPKEREQILGSIHCIYEYEH